MIFRVTAKRGSVELTACVDVSTLQSLKRPLIQSEVKPRGWQPKERVRLKNSLPPSPRTATGLPAK